MSVSISRKSFLESVAVAGALIAAPALISGCSSSDDSSSSSSSSSSASSTSASTESAESDAITKVRIVTSGSGEPYTLLAADGTWTGIDADVWTEIKNDTGVELEVNQAEFSSMFGELDAGRDDVVANCLAVKPERTEKYLASHPYYGDAQDVTVAPDNTTIYTFDDLAGTTCGVTAGGASQTIAEEMEDQYGFTVTLYEDANTAMNDMLLGRIDAVFTTDTAVYKFDEANGVELRILDERTLANNVSYFFPKTDEGQKYCDFVNAEIDKMLEDGRMASICEKWMYADMTQNIIDDDGETAASDSSDSADAD